MPPGHGMNALPCLKLKSSSKKARRKAYSPKSGETRGNKLNQHGMPLMPERSAGIEGKRARRTGGNHHASVVYSTTSPARS